ncbi:MAG: helix-turn-helix domain-containing protein [Sphingomonadales bacterium]|nr:helix-turn-helix domain-containing protein [Sphingomonadales bacterium]
MTLPYAIVYRPPPEHLADRVSSFYEFTDPAPLHDDVERSDRQQLRLMLQGSGHYHFANGRVDPSPRVGLLGPTSGSIRGISKGPTQIVGAGLWPAAWHALAGQRSPDWLDHIVDARELFGARADALWHDVAAAPDMEGRFAALAEFIAELTEPADPEHLRFTRLVDAWLTGNTDPHIDQLQATTGYNQRKLERMTRRYYGLPPKTLSRKYRALRLAAALARGEDPDLRGLGEGFYDQSHLIREVKRFAGLTPQRLKQRESRLLTEIAEGRVALRGSVSALVSDA